MNATTVRWFKTFRHHTGNVGRDAEVSLALARAMTWKDEQEAEGLLRVLWEENWDGWSPPDCQCKHCQNPDKCLSCTIEARPQEEADDCPHGSPEWCDCGHWHHANSLHLITDPDDDYKRFIEAELCLELMKETQSV